MKPPIIVLSACFTLLASCTQVSAESTSTPETCQPTTEPALVPTITPATPSDAGKSSTPTPDEHLGQPPPSQEELKQEWRLAINGSEILFATCIAAFETNSRFQKNEIDIATANDQLSAESNFVSLVFNWFIRWGNPSEAVLPYKTRIERNMEVLIELLVRMQKGEIGSRDVTDSLFDACSTLNDAQSEIVFASFDAGLTQDSVRELESEVEEIYQDILNIGFSD